MNVEEFMPNDLDVQKAVVESLAADKAEQDLELESVRTENAQLKSELSLLKKKIEEMRVSLEKAGDILAKNVEGTESSKVTLLERNTELNDRFLGETRDHVLEAIKEARDAAEKDDRLRRAQILESVLVANDPVGKLAEKRRALEKFFNDNGNILTGPVISELDKCGISYKKGEEYLLAAEILKRTY